MRPKSQNYVIKDKHQSNAMFASKSEVFSIQDTTPEMINENLISLKAAYRHPFEYISPLLYQSQGKEYLTADNLFMEDEEEFHSQLGEYSPRNSDDGQYASKSLV